MDYEAACVALGGDRLATYQLDVIDGFVRLVFRTEYGKETTFNLCPRSAQRIGRDLILNGMLALPPEGEGGD